MPIHADKNLYPGINAHLNSILQNEPGGWRSYHSMHVTHISEHLDRDLPAGYFMRPEKSLQINEFDAGTGAERHSRTTPDATVYHSQPATGGTAIKEQTETTKTVNTLLLTDTFPNVDDLTGLVIYQAGEGSLLGRPITRIELLSPANKPSGSHHEQYMVKRRNILEGGLRLVEIDYLHQTPPLIHLLPDYSKQEEGAYPYTVLVNDPRPEFEKGSTQVFAWHVDENMPVIAIPLAGADYVILDLGQVYHHTFESARFFRMVVDYETEPEQFESYGPDDQKRIQKMLAAIHKAQHQDPESSTD